MIKKLLAKFGLKKALSWLVEKGWLYEEEKDGVYKRLSAVINAVMGKLPEDSDTVEEISNPEWKQQQSEKRKKRLKRLRGRK